MSRLEIHNVSKTFGKTRVLENLSVGVARGAFLALLGPSGCGKTTLLRLVAGLERPDSGEIRLDNRVITDVPPEKRGFGMVFQSYAVWPHRTVSENILYPLQLRKISREVQAQELENVLRLVHLEALRDRYPDQLSGGQQQRVALARGLIMKPPVLLLDEPLSNLDARLRAEMRREIRDLHRSIQMTLLYVTHDQREAFEMATDVAVMNAGRIEQMGSPDEIQSRPAPGFVRDFLAEG